MRSTKFNNPDKANSIARQLDLDDEDESRHADSHDVLAFYDIAVDTDEMVNTPCRWKEKANQPDLAGISP